MHTESKCEYCRKYRCRFWVYIPTSNDGGNGRSLIVCARCLAYTVTSMTKVYGGEDVRITVANKEGRFHSRRFLKAVSW